MLWRGHMLMILARLGRSEASGRSLRLAPRTPARSLGTLEEPVLAIYWYSPPEQSNTLRPKQSNGGKIYHTHTHAGSSTRSHSGSGVWSLSLSLSVSLSLC